MTRAERIENALWRMVALGYCPQCGCDRANTEDCLWCSLIVEARRALNALREEQ